MSEFWTSALEPAGSHLSAGWFWFFPLLFAIHDAEEAGYVWMEGSLHNSISYTTLNVPQTLVAKLNVSLDPRVHNRAHFGCGPHSIANWERELLRAEAEERRQASELLLLLGEATLAFAVGYLALHLLRTSELNSSARCVVSASRQRP